MRWRSGWPTSPPACLPPTRHPSPPPFGTAHAICNDNSAITNKKQTHKQTHSPSGVFLSPKNLAVNLGGNPRARALAGSLVDAAGGVVEEGVLLQASVECVQGCDGGAVLTALEQLAREASDSASGSASGGGSASGWCEGRALQLVAGSLLARLSVDLFVSAAHIYPRVVRSLACVYSLCLQTLRTLHHAPCSTHAAPPIPHRAPPPTPNPGPRALPRAPVPPSPARANPPWGWSVCSWYVSCACFARALRALVFSRVLRD